MANGVKVGDTVKIIGDCVDHEIPIGTQIVAEKVEEYGSVYTTYNGRVRAVNWMDYEKVPNYLELIANLSAEVARLSKRVTDLERKSYVGEKRERISLQTILDRFKENTIPLTREEIVAKAKADVEALKKGMYGDERTPYYVVTTDYGVKGCYADFIINRDKRTIVALMRGTWSEQIFYKGVSKASPDDCFNVHIGKAIALRRALGLEVPREYTNAPQPTDVKVGDIVTWKHTSCDYEVLSTDKSIGNLRIINDKDSGEFCMNGGFASADNFDRAKIIDDSDREVSA